MHACSDFQCHTTGFIASTCSDICSSLYIITPPCSSFFKMRVASGCYCSLCLLPLMFPSWKGNNTLQGPLSFACYLCQAGPWMALPKITLVRLQMGTNLLPVYSNSSKFQFFRSQGTGLRDPLHLTSIRSCIVLSIPCLKASKKF